MTKCSRQVPVFHSEDKPLPECSAHSVSTKLHTSFKLVFLSDEHSSCPPIPGRRKHQIDFHPVLKERSVEPCSTTSSCRFLKSPLFEIPLILLLILVTVASFSGCVGSLNSQLAFIKAQVQTQQELCDAAYSGDLEKVKATIGKGATVDDTCTYGTPVHSAIAGGHKDVADYLITKGADINSKGGREFGPTPLYNAIAMGNLEMAKYLVGKGADVNLVTLGGDRALHRAAQDGNYAMVVLLVENGADVGAKGSMGTPLHKAVAMMGQTTPDKLRIAELLVAKGADVNAKGYGGETPLHINSRLDIAKFLIASGADVNSRNDKGNTPLHDALYNSEDRSLIIFLIEHGAAVNARNKAGLTPLGMLRTKNKEGIVPGHEQLIEGYGGHE